jgi:sialate O-acetylesterase
LICSSWGGTLAQAWTPIDFINNDDNLSPMIDMYYKKLEEWKKTSNKTAGPRPEDKPASLYNGMIAPITNMTIRGTIWYQGESNTDASYLYRELFPTMIKGWRCKFNNFEMPFYFVQLASYTAHRPGLEVEPYRGQPRENNWAELREAQLMANSLKNTGMAVAIDIGETNNIHPGNKKDVGERLALWALVKDYGKDIECSGPLYAGYNIEDNKVRIVFSHVGNGLIFKGGKAKGFAIAGKNRKFIWADAKIDGGTIIVFNYEIKEPVAVRYAWDIDPENNLYNKAGLPASPFRTDDWNGVTVGAIW